MYVLSTTVLVNILFLVPYQHLVVPCVGGLPIESSVMRLIILTRKKVAIVLH
jgi:hypothetical protein